MKIGYTKLSGAVKLIHRFYNVTKFLEERAKIITCPHIAPAVQSFLIQNERKMRPSAAEAY